MRSTPDVSRRVALLVALIGLAIGIPSSSRAEESLPGCDEFTNMLGSFHGFTGGACYQGAPNAKHSDYQSGYCHTFHFDC